MNIGVLASGRGSNFQALLESVKSGYIRNAFIRVLISNVPNAPVLEIARNQEVAAVCIDDTATRGGSWDYDQKILSCLKQHDVMPDEGVVLLAGYMRILSPRFVSAYKNRIMNIHPALLPSFRGLEAQKQAFEYGVKFSGCTVHFVDSGVDTGPIILQAVVPVLENDTLQTLAGRILKEEHRIYPEAVKLFTEGKLRIEGRRVRIKE